MKQNEVLAKLGAEAPKVQEKIKTIWGTEGEGRKTLIATLVRVVGADEQVVVAALAEFCGNHAAVPVETPPAPAETPPVATVSTQPAEKPEKIDFEKLEEEGQKKKSWREKPVRRWSAEDYSEAKQMLSEVCAEEFGWDMDKAWAQDRARRKAIDYIAHAQENGWSTMDPGKARNYFRKGAEREEEKREKVRNLVISCGKDPDRLDMIAVAIDYNQLKEFIIADKIRNGDYDRGGRGRR